MSGYSTYQASGSHFLGLSFSARLNSFTFRTFANTLCPIWKASLQDRNESGMYNPERVRDAISKYIPFKAFILLVYLIWFASIFLWVIALPVICLYYLALCLISWSVLPKRGKDIIIVSNGKLDDAFENEVSPLIKNRALFLNYEERSSWPRWSLAVLLFHAFGPAPIPTSFLPRCLPAVILLRKFKFPSQFSFGPLVLDRATKLQNLRSSLASAPD